MRVPILRLGRILLTAIQSDLIDDEAEEFCADVMTAMSERETDGIVIDISGLEIVDSFMARILNDTANGVRLLGGQAVVCGIRPAVALTLVELGRDMMGALTALNLEQGLQKLRRSVAHAIRVDAEAYACVGEDLEDSDAYGGYAPDEPGPDRQPLDGRAASNRLRSEKVIRANAFDEDLPDARTGSKRGDIS